MKAATGAAVVRACKPNREAELGQLARWSRRVRALRHLSSCANAVAGTQGTPQSRAVLVELRIRSGTSALAGL